MTVKDKTDDRLKNLRIAKIRFKNKLYGDYGRECCSLQIAALNAFWQHPNSVSIQENQGGHSSSSFSSR